MALVKKLKIGFTDYTIRDKNTLRSLTDAQATQLLTDGTYDGAPVTSGEVFTKDDGTFQEFTNVPGEFSIDDVFNNENIYSFTASSDTLAYITNDICYKSTDNGLNWTQTASGLDTTTNTSRSDRCFFFVNNKWIALNFDADGFIVSSDLVTWETKTMSLQSGNGSPNRNDGVSLAYNGSVYVMCFKDVNNTCIYTSSDLENWSGATTYPTIKDDSKVIAVGSTFFMTATDGIYKSTDGKIWTRCYQVSTPYGPSLYAANGIIVFFTEVFMNLYYSADNGSTWVNSADIDFEEGSGLSIAFYNNLWMISNHDGSYVQYSTDLENWTETETNVDESDGGYLYVCNDKFVLRNGAVITYSEGSMSLTPLSLTKSEVEALIPSDSGNVYNSLTAAQRATLLSNGTYEGEAVESDTNFTQYDGTFQKFTKEQVVSDTAFVSTGHTMPNGNSYYVTKNSNGLYMAVPIDVAGSCYTSNDGENWTATSGVAAIPTAIHSGALYKNGVWVICNSNASSMAYSEDDGDTWETAYSATFFPDKSFVLAGDYFIICNGYNEPCYSADGKTWTQMSSGISEIYSITYDGTKWIAVTYGHKIYTNSDITNDAGWTEVTPTTAPVSNSFYSVTYSNGTYYIYGIAYLNGAWVEIVETSTDLLNWTHSDKTFPDNNGWQGGYSRFICNDAFVGLEINASLWYTTNGGADWSDEISSNGHSTLVGGDLWDVTNGAISTFDATTELGNVIRGISYNKAEVDTLLGGKQKTIGGGSNISVDQSGATASVSFYPSTTTEAPTSGTWGNTGDLLTDSTNHNSYVNTGYDELWQPIWRQVVLANLNGEVDIKTTEYFTKHGSITISNNHVVSGFSSSNYLSMNSYPSDISSYEILFKVKMGSNLAAWDTVVGQTTTNKTTPQICVHDNGTLDFTQPSSSGVWGSDILVQCIQANTIYWIRCSWDGEEMKAEISTDGINYTTVGTASQSTLYWGEAISIGVDEGATKPWLGSIYLDDCYIKINGKIWWKPYRTTITPTEL